MFCISNCILIAFQPEMPLDIIRLAAFVIGCMVLCGPWPNHFDMGIFGAVSPRRRTIDERPHT